MTTERPRCAGCGCGGGKLAPVMPLDWHDITVVLLCGRCRPKLAKLLGKPLSTRWPFKPLRVSQDDATA